MSGQSTKTMMWIIGSIILSIVFIVIGSLMVNAANNDPMICRSSAWAKVFGWLFIAVGIIWLFWNVWQLYKEYKRNKQFKGGYGQSEFGWNQFFE